MNIHKIRARNEIQLASDALVDLCDRAYGLRELYDIQRILDRASAFDFAELARTLAACYRLLSALARKLGGM